MGDNPKNRGRQHLKNKSKYKTRPKVAVSKAAVRPRSPPSLGSNWDRYADEGPMPNDNVPSKGSDFSLLAQAPISKGSHFKFKPDAYNKYKIQNHSSDSSGLFNLDLNLLGLSIACIPFNERCNIPDLYFTDIQHNIMRQTANHNSEIYQHTLLNEKMKLESLGVERLDPKKNTEDSEIPHTNIEDSLLDHPDSDLNNDSFNSREQFQNNKAQSKNHQLDSQIDKLSELEEEFDRVSLIKQSSESSKTKENIFSLEGKTFFPHNQLPSRKENSSGQVGDYYKGPTNPSPSSILETESLEQWLDDVLEN